MLKKLSKIINWKEYLSLFLTLFFVKYSFINNFNLKSTLSCFDFYLLFFGIICMITSGDLLASFHYKEKKNKTKQLLALILLGISLIISISICIRIHKPYHSLIFITLIVLVYLYSINTKTKTLFNNIILAAIQPISIIILWHIDYPNTVNLKQWNIFLTLEGVLLYVIIVTFAANLIKHIVIDLKNKTEDHKKQYKTLPIVFGVAKTRKILFQTTAVNHVLTIVIISLFLNNLVSHSGIKSNNIILVLYIHMSFHHLYFCYLLIRAKEKSDYEKLISTITNILLINTILFFPVMAYYIKHVIKINQL